MAFFDVAPAAVAGPRAAPLDFDPREYVTARARQLHTDLGALLSPLKHRRLVECRRVIATELRSKGLTLPEIGRAINRNHTTVMGLLGYFDSRRK